MHETKTTTINKHRNDTKWFRWYWQKLTINARVLSSITCLISGTLSHKLLIFHAVVTSLSQIWLKNVLLFSFFGGVHEERKLGSDFLWNLISVISLFKKEKKEQNSFMFKLIFVQLNIVVDHTEYQGFKIFYISFAPKKEKKRYFIYSMTYQESFCIFSSSVSPKKKTIGWTTKKANYRMILIFVLLQYLDTVNENWNVIFKMG